MGGGSDKGPACNGGGEGRRAAVSITGSRLLHGAQEAVASLTLQSGPPKALICSLSTLSSALNERPDFMEPLCQCGTVPTLCFTACRGVQEEWGQQAAEILCEMAHRCPSSEGSFCRNGGVHALLSILCLEPMGPLHQAVAYALCGLLEAPGNREVLQALGGMEILVKLFRRCVILSHPAGDATLEMVGWSLLELASSCDRCRDAIMLYGGVPSVVSVIQCAPNDEASICAAGVLCALASGGSSHQEAIAAAGGVAALGQLLHRGLCNRENGGITEMAAWALQKLAFGHRNIQMEVLRSGTLAQLVESLDSALGDAAAEKVAWALYDCTARSAPSCEAVVELGGVSKLVNELTVRKRSPSALKASLWALLSLAECCEAAKEEAGRLGAVQEGARQLLGCHREGEGGEGVLEASLAAIAALTAGHKGNQTVAREMGVPSMLLELLCSTRQEQRQCGKAGEAPSASVAATQHCLAAIHSLATNNSEIQVDLVNGGAIPLLLWDNDETEEGINMPTAEATLAGEWLSHGSLSALAAIVDGNAVCKAALLQAGGLERLVFLMTAFLSRAGDGDTPPSNYGGRDVLVDVLQLLRSETEGYAAAQQRAADSGAMAAVVETIRIYGVSREQHDQSRLATAVSALRAMLMSHRGNQMLAVKAGVLPGLLHALSFGIVDAGWALSSLLEPLAGDDHDRAVTPSLEPHVLLSCVPVVVAATNLTIVSSPVRHDLAAPCVRCLALLSPHCTQAMLATYAPQQLACLASLLADHLPDLALDALSALTVLATADSIPSRAVLHQHAVPVVVHILTDTRCEGTKTAAADAARALVQHSSAAVQQFLDARGAQQLMRITKCGPFHDSTTAATKALAALSSTAPTAIALALVSHECAGLWAILDLLTAGSLGDLTAALLSLFANVMRCGSYPIIYDAMSEFGAETYLTGIIAAAGSPHPPSKCPSQEWEHSVLDELHHVKPVFPNDEQSGEKEFFSPVHQAQLAADCLWLMAGSRPSYNKDIESACDVECLKANGTSIDVNQGTALERADVPTKMQNKSTPTITDDKSCGTVGAFKSRRPSIVQILLGKDNDVVNVNSESASTAGSVCAHGKPNSRQSVTSLTDRLTSLNLDADNKNSTTSTIPQQHMQRFAGIFAS